jgi:hypothetical protein
MRHFGIRAPADESMPSPRPGGLAIRVFLSCVDLFDHQLTHFEFVRFPCAFDCGYHQSMAYAEYTDRPRFKILLIIVPSATGFHQCVFASRGRCHSITHRI